MYLIALGEIGPVQIDETKIELVLKFKYLDWIIKKSTMSEEI